MEIPEVTKVQYHQLLISALGGDSIPAAPSLSSADDGESDFPAIWLGTSRAVALSTDSKISSATG
jgi:hypothetical protein